jgi:hypothetical protein
MVTLTPELLLNNAGLIDAVLNDRHTAIKIHHLEFRLSR